MRLNDTQEKVRNRTMKQIVIIDNYDSFTYNLMQAVAGLAGDINVRVVRNDAVTASDLKKLEPTHLIISPGPGCPEQAGNSNDIIARWAGKVPILGVCLGHQCIGQVFGARIVRAHRCMHGKTSWIQHDRQTIFQGLSNPLLVMRYHSLIVNPRKLNRQFVISARSEIGEIMGIRCPRLALEGVQFHPESFAGNQGDSLLKNFLNSTVISPAFR